MKPSSDLRKGQLFYAVSLLFWIPQAWLISRAVGILANAESVLWTDFIFSACLIILFGIVRGALEFWSSRKTYIQARSYLSTLRQDVFKKWSSQSPLDKGRASSGQVASAWVEQADAIVPWLARYQSAQWRVMLVPPVIFLCVGFYSWVCALILLFSAPLIPIFMAIVGWKAQSASEEQMLELGTMHGFLLDRLRGLSTLRAMNAVNATAEQLQSRGYEVVRKTMRVLRIAFLSSAVLELFSALGVALVAVYVGFHLLGQLPFGTWHGPLSLQTGLFILMLSPTFFEPLRELSAVWHDRANGLAAEQHLKSIENSAETRIVGGDTIFSNERAGFPNASNGDVKPNATNGMALEFCDAVLSLPFEGQSAPTLNFRIEAGAHVAITGASGSGKSLVLAAVAGLFPLDKGEILLDGQPMNEENAQALRQRMAWMGQKPHFFTGSVMSNITLGRQDVNSEKLQKTLQAIGLANDVSALKDVPLGEGGSGISGGEGLRLALARMATRTDADLFLLDEPTAHLDSETAEQVTETIIALAKNKTLLIATHDPLLISRMSQTISLPEIAAAS